MWSTLRKEAILTARLPGGPCRVKCAECAVVMRESVKPPLFVVDHLEPATDPSASIHDWNDYFGRLFCPASELQILCVSCHNAKTAEEDSRRVSKKKTAVGRHR